MVVVRGKEGMQVAYIGLKDQIVLSQARDTISIKKEI